MTQRLNKVREESQNMRNICGQNMSSQAISVYDLYIFSMQTALSRPQPITTQRPSIPSIISTLMSTFHDLSAKNTKLQNSIPVYFPNTHISCAPLSDRITILLIYLFFQVRSQAIPSREVAVWFTINLHLQRQLQALHRINNIIIY